MGKSTTLSVIIPVYNAEKTLHFCLDSVKNQTYGDYEVILVDDGSSDRSLQICNDYMKNDYRFKVIHKENGGVSSARNQGLDMASGKYVMFIDCDDYIKTDFFSIYVHCMEAYKADVVIGGLICKTDKAVLEKKVSPLGEMNTDIWEHICLLPEMFGYVAGKIHRLDLINKNHIRFNENMYSQEDLDFNMSVYEKCSKVVTIDYAGYEYEYVQGKRKPPVWDFIANTLKMHRIGSEKTELSIAAKKAMKARIVNQIFSFLYNCKNKEEYQFAVNKLSEVESLNNYLQSQKINGESRYVIACFLKGRYERLYRYFMIRKNIKKLLGKTVSE